MVSLNSKELKQAKQYIKEGKFDDAIRILDSFEESGGLTLYETVSCHLIRCDLYLNQRSYRNGVKLAEKTYKQSLDLGNNLVTVDTLLILAHSLIWLENPKKALERLKQAEKLLSSLKEQQPSDCIKRESRIAFLRGMAYNPWFSERGDLDLALKYQEQSIEIQESHGRKPHPYSFLQIAWILSANKGELNRALTFAKKGLKTAEESGKMPAIAWGYHLVGIIYSMKGDADQSINFLEKNLEISQKLKDKQQMAYVLGNLGEIYAMKGAFDRALEFLNESMELNKELNRKRDITFGYQQLINILIQKGDIEKAKENLNYMERITNQLNDNTLNIWYLLCKALILKTSPRARSRGKAEEILVQALKEEIDDYQLRINVLLELAELLIIELRLTNDLGVLQELESYIAQLLEITQKSHSFLVLGEIYILQAKLALINFDLKKARILLTKGQQISESFGLNFLAQKISNEHDKLLKQLEDWENLKESNASIAERIEMSHMNEQMNSMV